MKLRILSTAQVEAVEAAQYFEDRSPGLGSQFLDALDLAADQIAAHPSRWPVFRRVQGREYRHYLLTRFQYVVVYEVRGDDAAIINVSSAARLQ